MNQNLLKNNYLLVRNFIDKEFAQHLGSKFEEDSILFDSDTQVPGTPSKYNYPPALELLCNKTGEVSSIVETPVLPTYTYGRVYKKGDELKIHSDRPECEISLTLHLSGDEKWPIYIEKPNGNYASAVLYPGDALVYLGCVAKHGRKVYTGNKYSQFFLHYVRSDGVYSDRAFDVDTTLGKTRPARRIELSMEYKKLRKENNL